MTVLDENYPESQRELLRAWRIPIRQIGYEVGHKGLQDDEILPLLLRLRRPTFFSLDFDFYRPHLRHARYCLVVITAGQYEAASFTRRLLQHPEFDTEAKRLGAVLRVSHVGVTVWSHHAESEEHYSWPSAR